MKNPTIMVTVDEKSNVEKTIRKFKRLCESYGVVKEYKKRQDYKKPSVKNKEKLEAAQKGELRPLLGHPSLTESNFFDTLLF